MRVTKDNQELPIVSVMHNIHVVVILYMCSVML